MKQKDNLAELIDDVATVKPVAQRGDVILLADAADAPLATTYSTALAGISIGCIDDMEIPGMPSMF